MPSNVSNKLILYNYFRSSTSYRARIALHLKGLEYDYRPIHLLNNGGEQHSAEYRELNPTGGVPTLVDGDFVLGQSMAILLYLDQKFPAPELFPQKLELRAKIMEFCEGINCAHSLPNLQVLQYLEKEFQADQMRKNKWIETWMSQNLLASEKFITKTMGSFCFGDQVSAADCFLIPQLTTAQRFQVNLEPYPKLLKIFEAANRHPAFIKAHPFRQIDTPPELKLS